MAQKNPYVTKRREQLLAFFQAREGDCFSARDLLGEPTLPIPEATVYRLLSSLTRQGKLRRFVLDGGGTTYQYNDARQCGTHLHLRCVACNRTLCADGTDLGAVAAAIGARHAFAVDAAKTVLYGVCGDCGKAGTPCP